jgi:hypothetical protein
MEKNIIIDGETVRELPLRKGYFVSETGRVYSTYTGGTGRSKQLRELSPQTQHGYRYVTLGGGLSTQKVSRLVAATFLPNPQKLPYVCHKDDNRSHDHFTNLYWGTPKDNYRDMKDRGRVVNVIGEAHPSAKLNRAKVRLIRLMIAFFGWSHRKASKYFGISYSVVGQIKRRQIWKHV